MKKTKFIMKAKRLLSGFVATAIAASMLPTLPAMAEETTEKYPYTLFAGSSEEGAITVNAGNFCVNGNVATNGTIVSSGNMNINGTKTENAGEETIYILKKLNYVYFSGDNVDVYPDDYSYEEINIDINDPMAVQGELELTGNINLNTGIKALEDVNLNGEVKNTNDSLICSETGDIVIDSTNVNLNGLVYAPHGDVEITAQNLNLNNVIIIADTITFNCPSVNANYNISMAELVGTESDVNVELYAFGEYNLEANSIDIKWYTNYSNSSYEIWTSADNTSYTSVATVTDSTEYQYAIDEDFDTKYFKISLTTNYNEYIESIPFIVRKKENGYFVDFLDSEDDGLPDVFEISLGTDINDADSDKDGLSDFQEFYITGTEPTIYDSVVAEVPDADADSDNDALSNIQEIELGTNPQLDDSDDDDISDYNELYVYETNPINPDSDNDRLEDGDELHIGLDPTNPETFGTPDAEYKVEQTIPADSGVLSEINIAENAYELSVELKTNGFAEKEVTVSKSGYSYAIENDAMIGLSADICISDTCNPEEIVLKYSIKESYIDNTLNLYSSLEEFQGIKRLNIFKFHEDTNMLLPIETDFDVENGLLYAEVDELGTYCIMDMEIWLNNLGVEMPEESQSEENVLYFNSPSILSDAENSGSVWSPTYENVPIDLIFILQSAGKSSVHFDTEKQLIIDFASSIMREYRDVKITVVEFKKEKANLLIDDLGREYFTNIPMLFAALNNIEYSYESDYCDRGQAFKILLNDVSLNYEHDIYVYELINGTSTSYGSYDNENIISKVKNNEVRAYSEIMPYGWQYRDASAQERISKAITDNKDLFITLNSDTLSAMSTHFPTKLSPARPVYEIIVPTRWKKISLDGQLAPDNNIDTDEDTLTDWEEVDTERLIWNEDGSFSLPTFNIAELVNHLTRFQDSDYNFFTDELKNKVSCHYLPILSDPTDIDSDGDELRDDEDSEPLKIFLNELLEKVKLMEKYIDEYFEYQYINDKSLYDDDSYINTPNSTIAINIIRNLYYGSEKKIEENMTIKDHLENMIQQIKWDTTDGTSFPLIREYIDNIDSSIIDYFRRYRKGEDLNLFDNEGNNIDFLHMMATLGAERYDGIIDPNLAGWAGDLQSAIVDLRKARGNKDYDSENIEKNVYRIIIGQLDINKPRFSMSDLLADVDAKNLSILYNENDNLSKIIKDYYLHETKYRFTSFVDSFGGYEKLHTLTYDYTRGNGIVKHMILNFFAKDEKVTDEESNALCMGFMEVIGEKLYEESN